MANISGIPLSSISQIAGKDITSVINIGGLATSGIPGWPSSGPSCTPTVFGYSDARRNPPSYACVATPQNYDFDDINGLLYVSGGCGTSFAPIGFYSDGVKLWNWNGNSNFILVGSCPR
jgi:hypothetical protein